MQTLPKMFLASSMKDKPVLSALAEQLKGLVEPIPWTDDIGKLSRNLMEWAQSTVDRCRFGLFVLTSDDRWGGQANGNVLLEFGLFAARHGLGRAFIVTTVETPVAPDLAGILTARFDRAQFEVDPARALAPVVRQVREEIPLRLTLEDEIQGPWIEFKSVGRKEGPYALVNFLFDQGELKLEGRSFGPDGRQRLEWPHELNRCWVPKARDEVFHTFDGEYNQGQHKALGVSRYRFEKDREHGDGYFVVHGAGGIKEGQIGFALQRVTNELLAKLGLPLEFDFGDRKACEALIQAVIKSPIFRRARVGRVVAKRRSPRAKRP